ncbi:MAG TPA: sulfite exporter TauE/SafE family protein [Candidatus Borkfalkia stercoripullorum]|nr:sulfite exporter TauE/SafE family protein [Candidatus Borkfalkia stercoripullorum]
MRFIVYLIAGLAGGVLGGMGMGGGTVLIPILTIFCGVEQHLAQSVNLLSFLPMALLSLGVHFSNGLVDTKGIALMIVPAVLLSAVGSYFVKDLTGPFLRAAFGVFLCILSVWQAYQGIVQIREKRGDKARPAQR